MKISATNKLIAWLSVVSLAFLLLVSPCKVRNFFQAELGLPQTEVSNKNKSTFSNYSCDHLEVNVIKTSTSKSNPQHIAILPEALDYTFALVENSNSNTQLQGAQITSTTPIPLYILYKNFKDYL
ncbi:MAG TPA: hypothetical protein EYO76_14520 [Flavobacteriaceae bacterium]|nr:hypothetical protein [Flavobacteriaceae bacterium]